MSSAIFLLDSITNRQFQKITEYHISDIAELPSVRYLSYGRVSGRDRCSSVKKP